MRNCMKVFRATLTALLMLVGVAWVGSAQVDANPVDMRVWVGKYPIKMYPTDVVGGWTFLESPKVKTRIAAVLGPNAVSEIEDMAAQGVSPIIKQGDWIIAGNCLAHFCPFAGWIVAINVINLEMLACLALYDFPTVRFGASGKQIVDVPRGGDVANCPPQEDIFPVFDRIFGLTIASVPPVRSGTPSTGTNQSPSYRVEVPLTKAGGTFVVPVEINGAITLDFTIDSGASDVSVPADVFSTLVRTGTIRDTDILGKQTYVLADGSKSLSAAFTIGSLKVGNKIVENVRGSVVPAQGSLLLGQSFLERFKSWSIDNTKHELLLESQ
jgi:clan AA aspartic protease (TIGR02281 family)